MVSAISSLTGGGHGVLAICMTDQARKASAPLAGYQSLGMHAPEFAKTGVEVVGFGGQAASKHTAVRTLKLQMLSACLPMMLGVTKSWRSFSAGDQSS